jgi:hypothetical protein
MHKTTHAAFSARPKEGRLLARMLAEDMRRAQGQASPPFLEPVVTGEIRRDWSAADEDGPQVY